MAGHSSSETPAPVPPAAAAPDFVLRRSRGRDARAKAPRSQQGPWIAPPHRIDPISLLEEQAESRVAELVPLRYERMSVSAFAFYRGAALLMASDLATMAHSGITVQLCGDAHLSNFGVFGTPERRLVFDMNDFDETLPGPFEWDLKRLATSFAVAARQRGFSDSENRDCVMAAVRGYRKTMLHGAEASVLDAWYDRFDAQRIRRRAESERRRRSDDDVVQRVDAVLAKARRRDRRKAFSKLVGVIDGRLRILARPPLIVPIEGLLAAGGAESDEASMMREVLERYRETLPGGRHPITEYRYRHMARRVGGVGSVGTRAWVILLSGRDDDDPLLLQAKEERPSVLERFLGPSEYENAGERVVRGQRLMQASSDIFLGWHRIVDDDGRARDFCIRQLQDWKGGIDPDAMTPRGAALYARVCGETLAHAHARSGDRLAVAGYLGRGRGFEEAVCAFADTYADQNEQDFASFRAAVESGRLPSVDATGAAP